MSKRTPIQRDAKHQAFLAALREEFYKRGWSDKDISEFVKRLRDEPVPPPSPEGAPNA